MARVGPQAHGPTLVGDLSLETVLERIVQIAREQVGARYAALGVVDERGELYQFIPIGMKEEDKVKAIDKQESRNLYCYHAKA